ncbi:MFS transporter [Alphaproteobacteria bacterium]|nr:MFS transporter [Alphaproteobacteria bacterium]
MKNFFLSDPKLLLYGFAIIFFASYGQTFFISIFNEQIRETYSLSDGEFGLVYSCGTLASSIILVAFAKLIDHIDLRLYSVIVSIGLAIACAGVYLSYESVFFLFFLIFGLRFFGQGAMSHAGDTTMSRYFGNDRGKALSFASFGGQIGVMFLPIIAVKFLNIISWQQVWMIASLSILIIFIPLLFLSLKNQNTRHSNFKENNKDIKNGRKWKTREIIFDKKFYIYLPLSISAPFISTGLMFHQVFIVNQKNWTLEMLASGYVLLGVFSIIGLMLGGPIVDRFTARKVIMYKLLPLFLAIIILIFFDNYLAMFVYLSLLGFNMGIGSPLIGSLWAELYGLESLGSIKALLHAAAAFASALSPVIFGYIIDFGMGIVVISFISIIIIFYSTFLTIYYQNTE